MLCRMCNMYQCASQGPVKWRKCGVGKGSEEVLDFPTFWFWSLTTQKCILQKTYTSCHLWLYTLRLGETQRQLTLLCRQLAPSNYECSVLLLVQSPPLTPQKFLEICMAERRKDSYAPRPMRVYNTNSHKDQFLWSIGPLDLPPMRATMLYIV